MWRFFESIYGRILAECLWLLKTLILSFKIVNSRTKCNAVSRWENGLIESFKAGLRDEVLDGEIFYSLRKLGLSRKVGVGTTTWTAHTSRSAISRRPPQPSYPPWVRGRIRNPDQLR